MMEDKIREIVEAMGFSFSIGDIYHLNQWLQQPEQLPAVLYVMPINGGGEITVSGMLKKNIEPLLFFLDHEGIDSEGEDTNTIIERMRSAVEEFVVRVNDTRYFEPITAWSCHDVIRDMAIQCSGVSVSLNLILGTAAVNDPAFLQNMVEQYGRKIVVGVDAREGKVATHGWLETTSVDSFAFCESLRNRGVGTVIYTDIARDGGLQGTNLEAYRRLSRIEGLDVVASGGITDCSELSELKAMGIAGAILGKALYTGRLSLRDAVALVQKEG